MHENIRQLGLVKLVQVQPSGLIIETPTGYIYDPSRRAEVDHITITDRGIEATGPKGERLLDIHHSDHPETHSEGDNAISIGFTSHYAAMRARFGEHMEVGSAGENIIIEYDKEVWLQDLGQVVIIQNPDTGHRISLDVIKIAAPCEEFSHFAASSQGERLPANVLKSTLQFLGDGCRGFLLVLSDGQDSGQVHPGDRVFVDFPR
jgi:hypothetical protein